MLYAIRIDLTVSVSEEKVADWLCDLDTGYLAVREGGDDNPHIHIVLAWDKTTRGLRKNFLNNFPNCNGNGSYSLTEVKDEDKYNRYLCKGSGEGSLPKIVSRNGLLYSDDWIETMHARYYAEAPKPKNKRRLVDVVFDTCKEAAIDWHDRQAIARVYIKECMERKAIISTYTAKGVVNLVQCLLDPGCSAIDQLVDGI